MNQIKKRELFEKIDSYIKGNLNQEEIEELWIELLRYPELYRYFETEAQLQDMIKKRDIPESFQINRVEEPRQQSPVYKEWVYAAVAALILVIGLQFFTTLSPNVTAGQLALSEIDLNEMVAMDIDQVYEGDALEKDLKINTAVAMAYNDSTEMAITLFRQLLKNDLNVRQFERAELDIGILLYNKGEYEEAKIHFAELTKYSSIHSPFVEKGWWYYGNTLLITGDVAEAQNAISTAYSMRGEFQVPAFELMEKIDAAFFKSTPGTLLTL